MGIRRWNNILTRRNCEILQNTYYSFILCFSWQIKVMRDWFASLISTGKVLVIWNISSNLAKTFSVICINASSIFYPEQALPSKNWILNSSARAYPYSYVITLFSVISILFPIIIFSIVGSACISIYQTQFLIFSKLSSLVQS